MTPTFKPHPAVDPACPECRGKSYVIERVGEHAQARLCTCVTTCPICRGTLFRSSGGDRRARRVRCECTAVDVRVRRFNEARIPSRHYRSTRANFRIHPSVKPAVKAVDAYVRDFRVGEENRGLVLHGPVGRGKTHLMVAVLHDLVFRYAVSVRFVEFSLLLADLKTSFDRRTASADLMEPLVGVEVLAIDEMGKGMATEWETTVVDEIVSRRYNAARPILATTNYESGRALGTATPNLADPGRQPTLADRVGERVYSRLRETCSFVPVRGEDYRLTHGRKRRQDR